MNVLKRTLLASAAAMLAASAASAQVNYDVTTSQLTPNFTQSLTISGTIANYGPINQTSAAGLITLDTTTAGVLPTFCVDLFHDITIGGAYQYTQAPLTVDSTGSIPGLTGNPLTATQVAEIYSLADVGVQAYRAGTGTESEYVALQGAIWDIEYNNAGIGSSVTVTSTDSGINTAIGTWVAYAEANPLYSNGWSVIPGLNGQNPNGVYPGQALVTAPGPKVGEGLLGFVAMLALLIGVRYRGLFV